MGTLMTDENLLTVTELASALKVSGTTIYYWKTIHPDFPCRKVGRLLRFSLLEVLRFWESRVGTLSGSCAPPSKSVNPQPSSGSLKIREVGRFRLKKKGNGHGNY